MAAFAGPNIVQTNLVLCLDANDTRSYPGTGTSWKDLSGSTAAGTFINGAVYSTTPKPSISFTSTSSQYVNFGTSFQTLSTSNMSMSAWIYPKSYDSSPVGIVDQGSLTNGWGFWIQNTGQLWFWPAPYQDIYDAGTLSAPVGTWTNVSMTWDNSTKTVGFYYNGILSSKVTNSSASMTSSSGISLIIGAIRNGTAYFFNGYISTVSLYNIVLTDSQVAQDFVAHRGRYGL